jgi:CrcB protein
MQVLVQIGLVSLGSMLGGLSRWGVGLAFAGLFGKWFPWGTLFINVSGSFFLGWFATLLHERLPEFGLPWLSKHHLHLLVAVGFTGTYTTFSTFEYEAHTLFEASESVKGWAYLVVSLVAGLAAVRLGVLLARGG